MGATDDSENSVTTAAMLTSGTPSLTSAARVLVPQELERDLEAVVVRQGARLDKPQE
jgi:hypothetical protein